MKKLILSASILISSMVAVFYFVIWDYRIEYRIDKSFNSVTGTLVYDVRAHHWYQMDIIRSKYYYNITKSQADSVKIVEDSIGNSIKLTLNKK